MFATNVKQGIVVRVLLISVVLVNSLASSAASVQAGQELASTANADTSITQQETTGCNAGPCSVTPSQASGAPSIQSLDANGSVTGITDPALIPNPSVYDFSADEPYSAPLCFPGGAFSGSREVRVIGSSWATWNPQIDGKHVLFASSNTIDILFTSPQMGVIVKAEPNYLYDWFAITIEAFDGSGASLGSFTRSIYGYAGASFLGVLSTSDDIAKITISSDPAAYGFAFSDMTYGSSSGTAFSPIAQAVLAEVGSQNYCGNFYDGDDSDGITGLINLPPGQAAFERFANLAKTADYEIDFVTMGWDEDKDPDDVDSPGDFFLQGLQELYENVQENPGNYANGVRVRILLGLKNYHGSADQRLNVLNDLSDLDILEGINWEVEVAYHDHFPGTHSHVKMIIVDGRHVITGGYNLHYNYLEDNPIHDMGIEVSGPIAQDALEVFDNLWMGAHVCTNNDCSEDTTISVISHDSAMLVPTVAGNIPVFSLFRDNTDKAADNAIEAVMSSASSEVNIIQNRFMNSSYYAPPQYVRGILNAIDNGNVYIKLLASSGDGTLGGGLLDQLIVNTDGICILHRQIIDLNGGAFLLPFFDARLSTTDNPIHTKALSIDDSFVIVGSQNFDPSAWGNNILDLAEYSLGVDSVQAADEFQERFTAEWDAASTPECLNDGLTGTALQDSINQASPGTVMFIPAGVYTGSVTINKPLVLVGAGANQTIIQPYGSQPAFQITSSDVVITNMKISRGDGYGIELIDSSPSSLENIQIHRVVFENNTLGGVLVQGLISGSPMDYAVENILDKLGVKSRAEAVCCAFRNGWING